MPLHDTTYWSDRVRRAWERYDERLLRQVAGALVRPRNEWPAGELIERGVAVLENAAVIDRRVRELGPAPRKILALLGRGRQPRWRVGSLIEMLVLLGEPAELQPVFELMERGLLCPELPDDVRALKDFKQWLGVGFFPGLEVFAHPAVTARAGAADLGLPECPGRAEAAGPAQEADGLEWPLRLAVVWQRVASGPLRRTQQGELFKRDLDRVRGDPVLNAPPGDGLAEVPEPALLAVELARLEGILVEVEGELRAAELPSAWEDGLPAVLESLWAALPRLEGWAPREDGRPAAGAGNPYPAAYLVALLLLTRLEGAWARPDAVAAWVADRHPYWADSRKKGKESAAREEIETFLLGVAYPLRLVEAAKSAEGGWLVRPSGMGRWLLGTGEAPPRPAGYTQTLLVQPNLEVVAYRQGLTPALAARLSRFAAWQALGPACILRLEPETVYRALERGESFETIRQALERHGMRPTPPAVVEALRTWSDKRDRLSVYPSAVLFEFNSAEELNEALARGLPAARLSDRLAVVADERGIDFRHFRLVGTRDYGLAPERCVAVGEDGLTVTIDQARSDLMLEVELRRFAETAERAPGGGPRYRLTPATLGRARDENMGIRALEDWFARRAGQPLPPAARLLFTGPLLSAPALRERLVLHLETPEVADGLLQWPATRPLIEERLGPTALAVPAEHVEKLRQHLKLLGVSLAG